MNAHLPPDARTSAATPFPALPVRSVRRPLFGLILGGILASGAALALILISLHAQALRSGERFTASVAQLIAEQTAHALNSVDLRLQLTATGLAQLRASGKLNELTARELLRERIAESPFLLALSVINSGGEAIYSSAEASVGLHVSDRDYFRLHQGATQPTFHIGSPLRSRRTGAWILSASRPMLPANGTFGGVILAVLDPSYFGEQWRSADLGDGGSVALFRRDGVLMMRSPFDETAMGKAFLDLPVFRMPLQASPAGHFSNASAFDGVMRMFAYRVLRSQPELVVVVGEAYDRVLGPWRQLATIVASIWVTASAVIVILGWFLNKAWRHEIDDAAATEATAQRFAMATQSTGIGVWDWDLTAGRWWATPTYFTLLGYAHEQGIDRREDWLERLHDDDRELAAGQIQSALAGTAADYQHEVRVRHADGSFRWMRVIGRVHTRDKGGRASRLLGVMTDITESKQAENALRKSEERFRHLVDSTDGIVWEAEAATFVFTSVSNNAERLLGYPVADWLAPGFWASHIHPEDRDQAVQFCAACTGRSEDHEFEYRFIARDGRLVWLRDLVKVVEEEGKPRWLRGLIVDITERRLAEEALRDSLKEKEGLLKEVHHRVKNNLQVITSLLRLESRRRHEPETREVLSDMQGRIRSMALLHETLYKTGRFGRVDLAGYLQQLATQLFRAQNAAPGAVGLVLELSPVAVAIDQAIPCGLIVNELLTNSLKHAFPDGRSGEVRVGLEVVGGRVQLRVSDTGAGLSIDFDSRRGASLGLQLVSDLARQLGGALEIGPGPAAVFTLTFASEEEPGTRGVPEP